MLGNRLTPILGGILALIVSTTAAALPIDVAETTDFWNTNSGSTFLGAFDAGVNRVRGAVNRPSGDTFDFWHAELPDGLQITSIVIEVSGSNGASWRAIVEDRIVSSFDELDSAAWLTTSGDGGFPLPVTTGALPFPSGTYYFANITFLNSETAYDYEWAVEVAPVPEPGTAVLLGLGLTGLASSRRRHSTSRHRR
jgi:hypothetical protein